MADELDRLFACLVEVLARDARIAVPFPVAEICERLVPYRSNRWRLKVATHQDYEMTVLRLLAGERGFVQLDPADVREGMQREVAATNPDPGYFRNFPDAQVMINRFAAERVLRGEAAYAPPPPALVDDLSSEPELEPEAEDEDPELEPEAEDEEASILWTSKAAPVGISEAAPTFELAEPEESLVPRQCPYCGGSLPGNRKVNFCPHCGQPPSGQLKCPACGTEVDVGWAYCIGCGHATGFE